MADDELAELEARKKRYGGGRLDGDENELMRLGALSPRELFEQWCVAAVAVAEQEEADEEAERELERQQERAVENWKAGRGGGEGEAAGGGGGGGPGAGESAGAGGESAGAWRESAARLQCSPCRSG